jgi:hypothetical protein
MFALQKPLAKELAATTAPVKGKEPPWEVHWLEIDDPDGHFPKYTIEAQGFYSGKITDTIYSPLRTVVTDFGAGR